MVQFFRADGTLIDSLSVVATSTDSYGFARAGGIADIAGISVHTFDPGGLGYDNFRFDRNDSPAPEPGTFVLGGALLAGLSFLRLRRRSALR